MELDRRTVLLSDLVASRKVAVEVMLAVEAAHEIDGAVERETGLDGLIDARKI